MSLKSNFLIEIKDVPLISESLYFYVIQPVVKLVYIINIIKIL